MSGVAEGVGTGTELTARVSAEDRREAEASHDEGRDLRDVVIDWTGVLAVVLAAAWAATLDAPAGPRMRYVVGVALAVFAGTTWRAAHALDEPRVRKALAWGVPLSVAVAFLPVLASADQRSVASICLRVSALLVGWGGFFAVSSFRDRALALPRWTTAALLVASVAFALSSMVAMLVLVRGSSVAVVDEALYLLQARALTHGLGWPIPGDLVAHFALPQSFVSHERLFGQYPVGWPAILALTSTMGGALWTNVALGGIAIVLVFLTGARACSSRLGALAAALAATNYGFVSLGAGLFAHMSCAVALLAAACLLAGPEIATGDARARVLAAGCFLGVAVSIRPLTGVAMGGSVLLWSAMHHRMRWRLVMRMVPWAALGALPPVVGMLAYNHAVTGHALRFGYAAAEGALNDLGFGLRGIAAFDAGGNRVVLASDFTPAVAARQGAQELWLILYGALPGFALLPVLSLARAWRVRVRWRLIACFALLPLAHLFYYYVHARFYTELMPFIALGVASLVIGLGRQGRTGLAHALAVLLVAEGAAATLSRGIADYRHLAARRSQYEALTRAPEQRPALVMVVRDSVQGQSMLNALWWLNLRPEEHVVVARDLGVANDTLLRLFPGSCVIRLVRGTAWPPTPLRAELARGTSAPARCVRAFHRLAAGLEGRSGSG